MPKHAEDENALVVEQIMRAHRPAEDGVVWPAHITPAALIRDAEAAARATPLGRLRHAVRMPRKRRRRWAAGIATVAAGITIGLTTTTGATANPPVTPAILQVDADAITPAGPFLRQLAERAAARIEPKTAGGYSYNRSQLWSVETDGRKPGADTQVLAQDEQIWWAPGLTGRRIVTSLPPQSPQTVRAEWTVALPTPEFAPQLVDAPQPEEISLVIDGVPSTDPQTLAGQIAKNEIAPLKPLPRVRALAEMCRYHVLNPGQRAAVLSVLADTANVIYRGPITDRSNRTGMAFSIDNDEHTTRDILVFDAVTGSLLSHEQVTLVANAELELPANSVTAYVLYLNHYKTSHRG